MSFINIFENTYNTRIEEPQNDLSSRVKPYYFNAILFYINLSKANGMRYKELTKLMAITFIKEYTNLYTNISDDNSEKTFTFKEPIKLYLANFIYNIALIAETYYQFYYFAIAADSPPTLANIALNIACFYIVEVTFNFRLSNTEELAQLLMNYINTFIKMNDKPFSLDDDIKAIEYHDNLPFSESQTNTPCFKLGEGKQLLVKSFIPNGYKQVNFLDLTDKKLCLDGTTREKWLELTNKDSGSFYLFNSKSLTGIYNECPDNTEEVAKFLAENNLNSK